MRSLTLGKEEALKLYEEEMKHQRDPWCAAREHVRAVAAFQQRAKENENWEQNISGSGGRVREIEVPGGAVARSNTSSICPRKLIPPAYEKRDDLDVYLHHFEKVTRGQS